MEILRQELPEESNHECSEKLQQIFLMEIPEQLLGAPQEEFLKKNIW